MQKKLKALFQKYRFIALLLGVLLSATVITGCNSSDHVSLTGTFVDSPVQGLTYRGALHFGYTGANGAFLYSPGETIAFFAGEIYLGSAVGKSEITPVDLASGATGSSDPRVINLCRFLQTLDADGDPSNGIEITLSTRGRLIWNDANGANNGSIFNDGASIYNTGSFNTFMTTLLADLNGAGVFTVQSPRTLKSATTARKYFNTTRGAGSFQPYVDTVGIGVGNLAASTTFYNSVMGLNIVTSTVDKGDRLETTLKDFRSTGNKVVLMHYNDGSINYINNPVKLVLAVPNAQTIYDNIIAGGGSGFSAPVFVAAMGYKIGMALDPDGYILELIEVSYLTSPVLVGAGIGVNSLQASDDFYTRALGMKFDYFLYVSGFMNEIVTISPHTPAKKGLDVVLMHFFATKTYTNVPAKLVFTVDDPTAFAQAIRNEGLEVLQMPATGVTGVAKDPNGYEIQIVKTVI